MEREITSDGEETASSQKYGILKAQTEFALECFKEQCEEDVRDNV